VIRRFALVTMLVSPLVLAACANPNGGGLQDFGTVVGRVINASSNAPVGNTLVSIGARTVTPDARGGFVLRNVPIGMQTLTVQAAGFKPFTVQLEVGKYTGPGTETPASVDPSGLIHLNPAVTYKKSPEGTGLRISR
jgi:hypothetical protein